ncbi:MAG: hypothetical protein HOW73_20115 [Polyangiaceae bacterium]|nr:hypothetical protein [Polyangiaceae bacterium]
MSAAEQLAIDFDAPESSTMPVAPAPDPESPAAIALEITTELKAAEVEFGAIAADLAPRDGSWADELVAMLEDANRRAEEDLQRLRTMHARILGVPIEDLDRVVSEQRAKEKADMEAMRAQRVAPPVRAAKGRGRGKQAEPEPAAPPTKRLTDRQRELVGLVDVSGNVGRYTKSERIADWAALKEVMLALGARWVARKGFAFPDDVDGREAVRLALENGEVLDPRAAGFFPTPPELADALVARLDLPPGAVVLEPSAGDGALVAAIRRRCPTARIYACELLPKNRGKLERLGVELVGEDFLTLERAPEGLVAATMNPPFAGRTDVHHITRMIDLLPVGGQLAAIGSAGVAYREDRLGCDFRALVAKQGGVIEYNPDGAFAASGTMVRTVSLWLRKR